MESGYRRDNTDSNMVKSENKNLKSQMGDTKGRLNELEREVSYTALCHIILRYITKQITSLNYQYTHYTQPFSSLWNLCSSNVTIIMMWFYRTLVWELSWTPWRTGMTRNAVSVRKRRVIWEKRSTTWKEICVKWWPTWRHLETRTLTLTWRSNATENFWRVKRRGQYKNSTLYRGLLLCIYICVFPLKGSLHSRRMGTIFKGILSKHINIVWVLRSIEIYLMWTLTLCRRCRIVNVYVQQIYSLIETWRNEEELNRLLWRHIYIYVPSYVTIANIVNTLELVHAFSGWFNVHI